MNFSKFSLLFTERGERTAPGKPNSCAIIWCKPHCTVLNYLGPVAPYFSNSVECDATSCSAPCRTGPYWSDLVCSNSWMTQNGDPNRNSTEQSEPQKSAESTERGRKTQKAQKDAERRRKGLFRAILANFAARPGRNGCKVNRWLSWPVQAAPACTHLLTICERVQIVNMQ